MFLITYFIMKEFFEPMPWSKILRFKIYVFRNSQFIIVFTLFNQNYKQQDIKLWETLKL